MTVQCTVMYLIHVLEGFLKTHCVFSLLDLQPYSPVVKCLWYVTASLRQQVCLLQWDSGKFLYYVWLVAYTHKYTVCNVDDKK